ncbi:hypothetical protein KFU94_01670 [Chloroflexi bacterium TSY]|nr:hypothetical protein [Chloroflexi bacterium TSY]
MSTAGCSFEDSLREAAEDTDVTLIWRGFTHEWLGQVHRTGRFGNWIEVDTDQVLPRDVSLHHMARTGTASDDADFSMIYDIVQATHVRFVSGMHTFPVDKTELDTLHQTETVSISVTNDERLSDKDVFVALINGFSIQVRDGSVAKKLGKLRIDLSQPIRVGNQITFDIDTSIMMSCKSTECTIDEGFRTFTFW